MLSIMSASVQWAAAMDHSSGNVTDVTERLAEALPDFLADWTRARLYLVCGHAPWSAASPGMRTFQTRGGLAAGTLRRINEYIEGGLSNPISLHDLAAMAGLSDCHFARAFKQSTGMPPHRYLMQRRVERAAMLIQATQRPLSEIALEVGCCDQSHFSRLVARVTGHTPRELRRESFEPIDQRALPGVVA
ncbi:MAG: helix-turn-helix domain-containing protein [Pseudoxanthomonas sp.]